MNAYASAKDVMNNKEKDAKRVKLPSNEQKVTSDIGGDSIDTSLMKEDPEEIPNDSDVTSEDFSITEGIDMIFDDNGNEVARETKNTKKEKNLNKKELSPEEQKKKEENLSKLREKLSARIGTLREKRKAFGTQSTGAPKSREQMLAQRKKKEELKREEMLKRTQDETEDNSSSDLSSDEENDIVVDGEKDSVVFGNIEFGDGSRMTSDLQRLRTSSNRKKKKGPANNDIKGHLLKLEQKKRKFNEMSPEEQAAQREKDKWQKIMAQAEGVKVKDDEKLLKKALKRKEKQKLRSEVEWRDRKQIVQNTISARQKRREDNLRLRRENKGKKGKNMKLRKFTGIVNNKKKRAGFEGSAKSKGKSKT